MTVAVESPTWTLAPAWHSWPEWHSTLGPEVADLSAAAGFAPDPNQRLLLDPMFGLDRQGRPVAFESAVVAPRQAIKTGLLKMAALGLLFLLERRRIVWSAHEYETAQEAFGDLNELIEGADFLRRRIKRIMSADGRELIETTAGARLRFRARTRSGGRGLTGDATILDEAFSLKPAHLGALLPTMLTRPHGQVFYGSSGCLFDSAVLRGIRDRGRRGDDRLAYAEWGDREAGQGCAADDCDHAVIRDGCALDDVERWARINPALPPVGRQTVEAIRDMRRALPPEEFARELMVWHDDPASASTDLTVEAWDLLADPNAAPSGALVLAADVAPWSRSASVVAFGGGVLELIEHRPGDGWLVDRLVGLVDKHGVSTVAIDPAGPIGVLVPDLEQAGVPLSMVEGRDSVRASGALVRAVREALFAHRGEPEFRTAVDGAVLRNVGDGVRLSRRDSAVNISPLVAAAVALWASGIGDADYDILDSIR